ncbi:MAG: polyprenyl synthetase family protein [Actinomycetia bacterium]|nr:polyprenyl synthetase family protein [Actinomycetes bacterium]
MWLDDLLAPLGGGGLIDRVDLVTDRIHDVLVSDAPVLGEASRRVAGGGKRLRPIFSLSVAGIVGVFDDRVIDGAAAIELVQIGSLVHDDIFDEAATRRGVPTINAVEGASPALLAGDFILAKAGALAAGIDADAAALLAGTIVSLCLGQAAEMDDLHDLDRSLDAYHRSIIGKTSALFAAAAEMGAICAGLDHEQRAGCSRYGHEFGTAFQLLDDMLDLVADPERLGKPVGSDLSTGVYTHPVLLALDTADGDGIRGLLERRSNGDVLRARQLVIGSGALDVTLELAIEHARSASAALSEVRLGESPLAPFPSAYLSSALDHFTVGAWSVPR